MIKSGKLQVSIYFPDGMNHHKIPVIKAIRAAAYLGLKEAKMLSEDAEMSPQTMDIDAERYIDFAKSIIDNNGTITDHTEFSKYRDDLKEIAMAATLADDTYVAEEILAFINDRFRYFKKRQ